METVKRLYLRSWRGLAIAVSLALIAYLLYFYKLGSLLPGYSSPELATFLSVQKLHGIVENPVNTPYSILMWFLTSELHRGIIMTRVVAASYAVLMGLLFFLIVRAWCTYRSAFLATILFITSAGLLHFARFGTGDILQMGPLALVYLAILYHRQKKHRILITFLIAIISMTLLYVPGMVWFEALGVISLFGFMMSHIRRAKIVHITGLIAVMLICLAPLIKACIHNTKLLLQITGLPQHAGSLIHVPSMLSHTLLNIFIRSNSTTLLWVGHAPLLDAIEAILFLLGAYYVFTQHPARRLLMFGALVVGFVLVSFNNGVVFACLVPQLYLFIAIGLDGLLGQWFRVFPRNPVARKTGICLICIMLAFSVLYQVRAYFVAWPNAPATRQTFSMHVAQSVTIHTK